MVELFSKYIVLFYDVWLYPHYVALVDVRQLLLQTNEAF